MQGTPIGLLKRSTIGSRFAAVWMRLRALLRGPLFPLLGAVLLLACSGGGSTEPAQVTRYSHTATLLPNGKVLLVGGHGPDGRSLASAEIYDPASNSFTPTGSLIEARGSHAATLLPNGKVLVSGGIFLDLWSGRTLASAELYDPTTGTFTATGSMLMPRAYPAAAAMLPNGQVLLAGGGEGQWEDRETSTRAELFDPGGGTFSSTGSMTVGRFSPTCTPLQDGRVLVTGGSGSPDAEVYDPATGSFSATGSSSILREDPSSTLLPDGRVLLAGGWDYNVNGYSILSSAELYDPATGTFTNTGSMFNGRWGHTATLLPSGKVLVAGGWDAQGDAQRRTLATGELYDPATGGFTASFSLASKRSEHTATLLPNGKVLLSNGSANSELYTEP